MAGREANGLSPFRYEDALERGDAIAYVTRDIRIAQNAIDHYLQFASPSEIDEGIVQSLVPKKQFDHYFVETPYPGFYPPVPGGTEIKIFTAVQLQIFNSNIVK